MRTGLSLSWVRKMRSVSVLLGLCNLLIVLMGAFLIFQIYSLCHPRFVPPFLAVSLAALLRLLLMLRTAFAQHALANAILDSPSDASPDAFLRLQRRVLLTLIHSFYSFISCSIELNC